MPHQGVALVWRSRHPRWLVGIGASQPHRASKVEVRMDIPSFQYWAARSTIGTDASVWNICFKLRSIHLLHEVFPSLWNPHWFQRDLPSFNFSALGCSSHLPIPVVQHGSLKDWLGEHPEPAWGLVWRGPQLSGDFFPEPRKWEWWYSYISQQCTAYIFASLPFSMGDKVPQAKDHVSCFPCILAWCPAQC